MVNEIGLQGTDYPSETKKAAFLLNDIGEAFAQHCVDNPIGVYGNVYPDINAGFLKVTAYVPDPGISPVGTAALVGVLMTAVIAGKTIMSLIPWVLEGFAWAIAALASWEGILVCAIVVGLATMLTEIIDVLNSVYETFTIPYPSPVGPLGPQPYPAGIFLDWEAIPMEGWEFVRLEVSGGHVRRDEGNSGTIQTLGDCTLFGHFQQIPFSLTTSAMPTEGGIIIPEGTTQYPPKTKVNVTAVANEPYQFNHWSIDAEGTENPIEVIMTSAKTVVGLFDRLWQVTTKPSPAEGGWTTPTSQLVKDGEEATISVDPAADWEFDLWVDEDGDLFSENTRVTFKVEKDWDLTAHFKRAITLTTIAEPIAGGVLIPAGETTQDEGTTVTVIAAANIGYRFDHFSGDASGTDPTVDVLMDESKTVTAHFVELKKLTTKVAPEGAGTVTPPDISYHETDAEVSIVATAISPHIFQKWSGDSTSESPEITLTMDEDKTVTANFDELVELEMTVLPTGAGAVSPPGTTSYAVGTTVEVSASGDADYYFDIWSGDLTSTNNPELIRVDEDKKVTANFKEFYTLTTNAEPGEGGNVTPSGETKHHQEETVTIQAFSADGFIFDNWVGDAKGSTPETTVIMDVDGKEVTANFVPSFTVTISSSGAGKTSPEGEIVVRENGELTITAIPNENGRFVEWQGDASGSANPITLTITEDMTIIALFEGFLSLTTKALPPEGGSIYPAGTTYHQSEAEVSVNAIANEKFIFDQWTGDASGSNNPIIVIMDEDKIINGYFLGLHHLSITIVGEGSVSSPLEADYRENTPIVIWAIPEMGEEDGLPVPVSIFTGWSGDFTGTDNPLRFEITSDMELTATFKKLVRLTTKVSPDRTKSTIIPSGESKHAIDSEVLCTANPERGWFFSYWSGVEEIYANPVTVTMEEDKTITAHFIEGVLLSISVTPIGAGFTMPPGRGEEPPNVVTYRPDETAYVYAEANKGFRFMYWGGDVDSWHNPAVVTMNRDKSITAHFASLTGESLITVSTKLEHAALRNGEGLSPRIITGYVAKSNFAEDRPPKAENYVVLFSGGKDSSAVLAWAIEKYGKEKVSAIFASMRDFDHHGVQTHAQKVVDGLGIKLYIAKAELNFEKLLLQKRKWPGFPDLWCNRELKGKPTRDVIVKHFEKKNTIVLEGSRREEGRDRTEKLKNKNLPLSFLPGWQVFRPIANWTEKQVFEYLKERNIPLFRTYQEGWKRLNCWGCPRMNSAQFALLRKHYPDKFEKLIGWEKKLKEPIGGKNGTSATHKADYGDRQLAKQNVSEEENKRVGLAISPCYNRSSFFTNYSLGFQENLLQQNLLQLASNSFAFRLYYRSWKGQQVIRHGRKGKDWIIMLKQADGKILSFHCSSSPLGNDMVSATMENTDDEFFDFEGEIPAEHPANPLKRIPITQVILDKGDYNER